MRYYYDIIEEDDFPKEILQNLNEKQRIILNKYLTKLRKNSFQLGYSAALLRFELFDELEHYKKYCDKGNCNEISS